MVNKHIENVIRKAAHKGIEPLRRRYTGTANSAISSSHNSTTTANHTVRYRNGATSQQSVDETRRSTQHIQKVSDSHHQSRFTKNSTLNQTCVTSKTSRNQISTHNTTTLKDHKTLNTAISDNQNSINQKSTHRISNTHTLNTTSVNNEYQNL